MRQSQVLYLSQDSYQELYTVLSYKGSGSVLSVLLYLLKCQQSTVP